MSIIKIEQIEINKLIQEQFNVNIIEWVECLCCWQCFLRRGL